MKIDIELDSGFTGILQESAYDGDNIQLNGICHLQLEKPLKTRGISIQFMGILKVDVRKGLSLNTEASDAIEKRILAEDCQFLSGDGTFIFTIPSGRHQFPFSFAVSTSLPPTFHTERGQILYTLKASAKRILLNDLICERPICLRRCLTSRLSSLLNTRDHIEGLQDGLAFSVNTPVIVFREGGQLNLRITLALIDVENAHISSIRCGFKESISYRTSGAKSLHRSTRQASDISFPLGMKHIACKERDETPQAHDIDLRLIPRIHTDMSTNLVKVKHFVCFEIMAQRHGVDTGYQRLESWSKRYKIELPVIVSSKEKFWDGRMPSPPPYSREEEPPQYIDSLTHLPPTPEYTAVDESQ
ncbi:hypothetical protein NQZ79_g7741 [Umbelopsis isabellina]|nr:hypothetical protein NQZ79_g7741 [Umbelopsis isabellina]